MALTSISTYQDGIDQYMNNLLWGGDVMKARSALEAIRFLQVRRPMASRAADGRGMDYESLESTRKDIEAHLNIHDTANHPRTSFTRAKAINDL